ncbi:MAG: NADH-quinone oxidoreductase subunit D [Bdellovibrio sp.]|nr:NADH-quinone oxidoreductase subunit D [Bdellovibrio sp.]
MIGSGLNSQTFFKTDLTTWEIGPYHSSLPGPMRLKLKLDGEIVVKCEVETGFLHRGLEKASELHGWPSLVVYADHLDPEVAVFGELVTCLAVEEISGITAPPRAQVIRLLLAELARISGHLAFMVRMAKAVGSETVTHYVLRDREKILDLFELVTGARFSLNFLRFGGVRSDVTDGFIERVLEVCELIRVRMKEYNDIFTFNYSFLQRSSGVAPISKDCVRFCGMSGPNARAAGVAFDVRKDAPYLGYSNLDFIAPLGRGEGGVLGDVHDRFLIRLREINESMEILKQVVERIPDGPFLHAPVGNDYKVPAGEAYVRIESSRGLLGCHVVSDGKLKPGRVQYRVPSLANLMAVPLITPGVRVEDLPVVLASLDLGIAEADR